MKENQKAWASQSQEILKYLKKHGGDSKKKDSEGRSCKKIAKDLISYQWENQFLLAIIINLLILVIVFCLTGKKYMKYKILFIVLGGVLGFFYFV